MWLSKQAEIDDTNRRIRAGLVCLPPEETEEEKLAAMPIPPHLLEKIAGDKQDEKLTGD